MLKIIGTIIFVVGLLLFLSSSVFSRKFRKKRRETIGLVIGILGVLITFLAWLFPLPAKLQKEPEERLLRVERETKEANENVKRIERYLGIPIYVDGLPKADSLVFDPFARGVKLMAEGKWDDAIPEFEKSTEKAKGNQLATLYNLIGICYYATDRFDLAVENLSKSLTFASKFNDKETEAQDLNYLGKVAAKRGELDTALHYLQDALNLYKELGEEQDNGGLFIDIGLVYEAKGELDTALTYIAEAFNFGAAVSNNQLEHVDPRYLGSVDKIKENLGKTLRVTRRSLEFNKDLGPKKDIAEYLSNIGLVDGHETIGTRDTARAFYEEVLKISREKSYKEGEANALGKISMIFARGGQLDSALYHGEDALKLEQEIGDKSGEARQIRNIGIIHQKKGDWELAMKCYNNALKIDRSICYKEGEGVDLISVGLILDIRGEKEKALRHYEDALELFKGIPAKGDVEIVKVLQANVERLRD